jgi:transglutaminase-like putative cysteine protease
MPPEDAPFSVPNLRTAEDRLAVIVGIARRGVDAPIVRRLADLARARAGHDRDPRRLATEALRVVQRAGYRRDVDPELFQNAAYTAMNGGDCEDLTPLYMAVCRVLGLRTQAAWLDQPGRALNHVAPQVLLDGAWTWADPSVCGARLGEHPYAAVARVGAWYVLDASAPGGACAPF